MKNNILWTVLLVNLLALGTLFGYIGMRPVEFRAIAGNLGAVLQHESSKQTTKVVESAKQLEPIKKLEKKETPPPRRPPPRTDTDDWMGDAAGKPIAIARYVGPVRYPLSGSPPPVALYPFRVNQRTYPETGRIEVVLLVQNLSGYYWNRARVIFKSSDPNIPAEEFEIENWAIDGLAQVNYRFPEAELERRMRFLRIRDIDGERVETEHSRRLNEQRLAYLQRMGMVSDDQAAQALSARQDGSQVASGGFIGLWSRTTRKIQGDTALARPTTPSFLVTVPESGLPSSIEVSDIPADTVERQKAVELMNRARDAASGIEGDLRNLVSYLNRRGQSGINKPRGRELLAAVREAKARYDEAGLELTLLGRQSEDEQVQLLSQDLVKLSDALLTLLDQIEAQVRYIDPYFKLEETE